MMISPGFVFFFFEVLIFQVVIGVKGQKMAQNDKVYCLSHSIFHEVYIMILIFGTHV